MRSTSILALLLILVGVQPAWAQPPSGYCRIYRCMTMGTSSYYYCLKCSNCGDPVGCVGLFSDATGPCPTDCSAMHCGGAQAPTDPNAAPAPPGHENRPGAPRLQAPGIMSLEADADEPELLIGEYTKKIRRWELWIDIPGDDQGAIKAFLVTATVKPKKKKSDDFYDEALLGFAVPHNGDLSDHVTVDAYDVESHGGSFKFKFKERNGPKHDEMQCTIDLGPLMP
jgi:hypothetical protein